MSVTLIQKYEDGMDFQNSWNNVDNFLYPDNTPYETSMINIFSESLRASQRSPLASPDSPSGPTSAYSSPHHGAMSIGSPGSSSQGSSIASPGPHETIYDDLLDLDFILNNSADGSVYEDGSCCHTIKQELDHVGNDGLPDFSSTFLDIPDIKFDDDLNNNCNRLYFGNNQMSINKNNINNSINNTNILSASNISALNTSTSLMQSSHQHPSHQQQSHQQQSHQQQSHQQQSHQQQSHQHSSRQQHMNNPTSSMTEFKIPKHEFSPLIQSCSSYSGTLTVIPTNQLPSHNPYMVFPLHGNHLSPPSSPENMERNLHNLKLGQMSMFPMSHLHQQMVMRPHGLNTITPHHQHPTHLGSHPGSHQLITPPSSPTLTTF